jgi:hypothetical protein
MIHNLLAQPTRIRNPKTPCQSILMSRRRHLNLSHDAIALARWRTRWRLVLRATIRWLRRLQFDAILLLAIEVALICAAAVVSRVCVVLCIRGCGLIVLIVVASVVGRSVIVAAHGASGPACAVVGLATGFAAATGCEAALDMC